MKTIAVAITALLLGLLVGCGGNSPVSAETQHAEQPETPTYGTEYSYMWSEVVPLPNGREVVCVGAYAGVGGGVGVTCEWESTK